MPRRKKSAEPVSLSRGQVWRQPKRNFGYPENLRGLGGAACPLLAGFSLAAIAQISTADVPPELGDWAILAFAACAGLLLHSMQVAFWALSSDPNPATLLEWRPEATVNAKALQELREFQARKYEQMMRYYERSNRVYDLGLNAFLIGLVLILIPADWTAPRALAVAVAAAALAVEIWWGVANTEKGKNLPHPVEAEPGEATVEPLSEELETAMLSARARAK